MLSLHHLKETARMIENINKTNNAVEEYFVDLYKQNPINRHYYYIEALALQRLIFKKVKKNKPIEIKKAYVKEEAEQILYEYGIENHIDTPDQFEEISRVANEDTLSTSVKSLEFSTRVVSCFENEKIVTLRDLVVQTEADLLRCPNFGRKSLREVIEVLASMGLRLGLNLPGS